MCSGVLPRVHHHQVTAGLTAYIKSKNENSFFTSWLESRRMNPSQSLFFGSGLRRESFGQHMLLCLNGRWYGNLAVLAGESWCRWVDWGQEGGQV